MTDAATMHYDDGLEDWHAGYLAGMAQALDAVADMLDNGTMPADGAAGLRRDAERLRRDAGRPDDEGNQ